MRHIGLVALTICLLAAGFGCRETKQQAARKHKTRKPESLMDSYSPEKVKEYVQARKGKGEGAKVKVHISPSSNDLVIGQVNFGTFLELVKESRGWYGVRYYSRDGGEFYGWIKVAKTRYVGTQETRNEVIVIEDEHKKKHLTLQESDDALLAILAVPYKVYQKDAGSKPKKRFWRGKEPDGHDEISLLSRVPKTGESVAWAKERQKLIVELSRRAHTDYRPILGAYYDAIQWYVSGEKSRFTKQLKNAEAKRNEIARHFGN